jgi:hypothetical protein
MYLTDDDRGVAKRHVAFVGRSQGNRACSPKPRILIDERYERRAPSSQQYVKGHPLHRSHN